MSSFKLVIIWLILLLNFCYLCSTLSFIILPVLRPKLMWNNCILTIRVELRVIASTACGHTHTHALVHVRTHTRTRTHAHARTHTHVHTQVLSGAVSVTFVVSLQTFHIDDNFFDLLIISLCIIQSYSSLFSKRRK